MKVIHFDFEEGIDDSYKNQSDIYVSDSFNSDYNEINTEVGVVTGMHTSIFNSHLLEIFPNVKYLITRTVGTDHIDKNFFDNTGIKYFSVGQYGAHVIATHAFALLLFGARDLRHAFSVMETGDYFYGNMRAIDLSGKTLGIIGVGNIGKSIGNIGKAFGSKLLGYDVFHDEVYASSVNLQYVDLDYLLSSSDFIILACNLTKDNFHMINDQAIQKMKQGVFFVNCARGGLVDDNSLIRNHEKFAFIGLDVIEQENIAGINKFKDIPNIRITPHVGHLADSTVANRWNKTYEIIHSL